MRIFLLLLLLAWVTGLAVGIYSQSIWLVVVMIVAIAVLVLLVDRRAVLVVAGACLVWLGSVYGAESKQVLSACEVGDSAVVVVMESPKIGEDRVQYRGSTDNGCTLLVNTSRWPLFARGDVLQLSGGRRRQVAEFDGEFAGYGRYLARQGVQVAWYYPSIALVSTGDYPTTLWRSGLRSLVGQVFVEPDASIVSAMLLAERGELSAGLVEQFRVTGVSHVLAISGLHVSLLAGMLLGVLLLLPLSPWLRTVGLLALLWGYVLFVGAPVSAVRATLFWTLALTAGQLRALVSLPTILILTAAGMATVEPQLLLDVGWQLSVSAVTGIFLLLFLTKRTQLTAMRHNWLLSLLLVSLGAWLMTWPLVAYHFGNVSLIGLLANVLVVPVVPFIVGGSLIALLVGSLWTPLALLVAYPVHLLIVWLTGVTGLLAQVPNLFWDDVVLSPKVVVMYYLLIIAISIGWLRWQGRSGREVWE